MSWATRSFPVPLSPVISTAASVNRATSTASRSTACQAGLSPTRKSWTWRHSTSSSIVCQRRSRSATCRAESAGSRQLNTSEAPARSSPQLSSPSASRDMDRARMRSGAAVGDLADAVGRRRRRSRRRRSPRCAAGPGPGRGGEAARPSAPRPRTTDRTAASGASDDLEPGIDRRGRCRVRAGRGGHRGSAVSPPTALGRSRLAAAAPLGWLLLRLRLCLCAGAAGGSGVAASAGLLLDVGLRRLLLRLDRLAVAGFAARPTGPRPCATDWRASAGVELVRDPRTSSGTHAGDEREAAGRQREPIRRPPTMIGAPRTALRSLRIARRALLRERKSRPLRASTRRPPSRTSTKRHDQRS